MFDFEKLKVYQKARQFNKDLSLELSSRRNINRDIQRQLERAATSIILNIAEGTGRGTKPDRRRFYIISRGSVLECVAVFQKLNDLEILSDESYKHFYLLAEEISKMLYRMIKQCELES